MRTGLPLLHRRTIFLLVAHVWVSLLVTSVNATPKPPNLVVPPLLSTDVTDAASEVVAADFNLDGHLDLAVMTRYNVQIFLGKGNGTFVSHKKYPLKYENSAIATGDINSDGIPDLVLTNNRSGCSNCQVQILLGNGKGSFRAGVALEANAHVEGIAVADLNGDGNPDLVLGQNDGHGQSGTIGVFLGNGDGTFGNETSYFAYGDSISVLVDDFNQDGKPDIVFGNGDGVHILYGNGDGTFQNQIALNQTLGIQVASADFNGDGLPDIATQSKAGITVLLNQGGGKFKAASSSTGGLSGYFALGDFNGDGKIDIVMSGLGIMFGKGDGTFRTPTTFYSDSDSGYLITADLNGDHKMDAVQVSPGFGVHLLFGNGAGGLRAPRAFATGGYRSIITTGDFNNDGKTDVATLSLNDGFTASSSVLLGNGNGTFQAPRPGVPISTGVAIAAGDVNNDGNLDLLVLSGFSGSDQLYLCLGNGDGSFQSPITRPAGAQQTIAMTLADFNHDGKLDVAVAGSNGIAILLGNGDGTFLAPVLYSSNLPNSLVAADFNSDGIPDIATTAASTVNVLINNGDGTFQSPTTVYSGGNPVSVIAADFNNDGNQDLAFASTPSIVVLLGAGNGSFGAPKTIAGGGILAAAADFNGDGNIDMAGFFNGSGIYVYTGAGDGTFLATDVFVTQVNSVAAALLGNDPLPDILVGTAQPNSLGVVANAGK